MPDTSHAPAPDALETVAAIFAEHGNRREVSPSDREFAARVLAALAGGSPTSASAADVIRRVLDNTGDLDRWDADDRAYLAERIAKALRAGGSPTGAEAPDAMRTALEEFAAHTYGPGWRGSLASLACEPDHVCFGGDARRPLGLLRRVSAALALPTGGDPPQCDCGRTLTQCGDCAVGQWQAEHPDCRACCPLGGTEPTGGDTGPTRAAEGGDVEQANERVRIALEQAGREIELIREQERCVERRALRRSGPRFGILTHPDPEAREYQALDERRRHLEATRLAKLRALAGGDTGAPQPAETVSRLAYEVVVQEFEAVRANLLALMMELGISRSPWEAIPLRAIEALRAERAPAPVQGSNTLDPDALRERVLDALQEISDRNLSFEAAADRLCALLAGTPQGDASSATPVPTPAERVHPTAADLREMMDNMTRSVEAARAFDFDADPDAASEAVAALVSELVDDALVWRVPDIGERSELAVQALGAGSPSVPRELTQDREGAVAFRQMEEHGIAVIPSEDGWYALHPYDIDHGCVRGTMHPQLSVIGQEHQHLAPADTPTLAIAAAVLAKREAASPVQEENPDAR